MFVKPKLQKFPIGHLFGTCMQADDCQEDKYVFAVAGEVQGRKIAVSNIGGNPVEVIIDTVASVNVIIQTLWEELKKQHIKCVSRRSPKKVVCLIKVQLPLLK